TMRKGIKDTVLYGIKEVAEKYDGLTPSQIVDYKALRGDASDNIPGVTGIGEKTAVEILKSFGSLENLYKEIEANTKKSQTIKLNVLEKIKKGKEQAFLSQKLARMDNKAPVNFNVKDIEFGKFSQAKVVEIFQKLEFNSLLEKFFSMKKPFAFSLKNQVSLLQEKENEKENIEKEIENLAQDGVLSKDLTKLEMDLAPLVLQMEQNGIKVDFKKLNQLSLAFEKEVEGLQKQIFKLAKKEFNLNSPSQLTEILFVDLGISPFGVKKTPGGAISTNAGELKKIINEHPIIPLIIEYREAFKLKSGFVDSLPKTINPRDGRIHPHFHQLGTETGRMSCSDPNLQNIPTKTKMGNKIRECFVPESGFIFLSADYSQMDFRIAAGLSGDKKMIEFLRQGKDIHLMTASLIFKIQESDVSEKQRYLAKTLNYGVLYGLGPFGFAGRTGIEFKEAKHFIEQYFETFQGIARFVKQTVESTKQQGFSQTFFGRKRFLPEINSRDPRIKAQAERIARNFPVQGTAADVMKMAMVKLGQAGLFNKDIKLVLQLHDELLLETKENQALKTAKDLKDTMESVVSWAVPLKVEVKQGKNWGEV
ncbi:MAG: DNA polymerase, partial [Candidatus Pacebacteria bacterium]|nr:DNA polymerase [Candidatus Paceibacterota bacterium]